MSLTGYLGSSAVIVCLKRGQFELCSWEGSWRERIGFGAFSGWVWCFLRLGLGLSQAGIVVEVIALWVVGLCGHQGWILVLCSISAGLFLVFWLNGAALSSCEVLNVLPLYQAQDSFSYKGWLQLLEPPLGVRCSELLDPKLG